MRPYTAALLTAALLMAACSRDQSSTTPAATAPARSAAPRAPIVTVSADQAVSPVPAWLAPEVEVTGENADALTAQAQAAMEAGRLFGSADAAIPVYLALRQQLPDDAGVQRGLLEAQRALLE
ncbi:MAG: hypothetical protein M3Q40_03195, partial [Pseudomonadota bacterium]|nr:hypothetical protein [Pseudomonadota bacterium]